MKSRGTSMKKILIMLLSMIFLLTGCNIMGSDSNGNLKLDNDEETVIDMNTPERNNNKEIAQNYADELFQEYLKKNEIEVCEITGNAYGEYFEDEELFTFGYKYETETSTGTYGYEIKVNSETGECIVVEEGEDLVEFDE